VGKDAHSLIQPGLIEAAGLPVPVSGQIAVGAYQVPEPSLLRRQLKVASTDAHRLRPLG